MNLHNPIMGMDYPAARRTGPVGLVWIGPIHESCWTSKELHLQQGSSLLSRREEILKKQTPHSRPRVQNTNQGILAPSVAFLKS